jgi:hypothetical protein
MSFIKRFHDESETLLKEINVNEQTNRKKKVRIL